MNLRIRTKIVLIALVSLLLAIGLNAAISSYIITREYSDALQSRALVIGQSLALQLDRLLKYGILLDEVVGFEKQCQEIVNEYKDTSYAMVVDTEGKILFHNDPSQVGRRLTDPVQLEAAKGTQAQVLEVYPQPGEGYFDVTIPVRDSRDRYVAAVKVGLPTSLVTQRTRALLLSSGAAALVSLALAIILLAVLLPVWVTRPLAQLLTAVQEIGQKGAAGARRVEIRSRDEVGQLASAFNGMAEQIRELVTGLEQRVEERTRELAQRSQELEKLNLELEATTRQTERRSAQLAARGQVTRAASQIRDLDQLLPEVTRLISQAFGYYHVGIFIADEAGRYAVLRAANSEGGQRMLARNHKLAVGSEGIVGNVVGTGQPRVALDVGADAVHFDNPDLPQTRSELALPLRVGDQTFGALDVQSTQAAAFADEDVAILGMLADQVAIAIDNARLFAQTQSALQEAEETQRRYLRQEWERLMPALQATSHEYHASGVPTVGDAPLPEIEQAIQQSDVVKITSQATARSALAVPIKLRDQLIGVIDLHETEAEREWTADDVALVMAVADQAALALENARLLEQTEQRARREQLVTQIATKVRVAADVEGILRTGVQEIRRVLGASHGIVHLTTESLISKTGEARAASAESQEGNSEVVTQ